MDALSRHPRHLLDNVATSELAAEWFGLPGLDARRLENRDPMRLFLSESSYRMSRIYHDSLRLHIYRFIHNSPITRSVPGRPLASLHS
jgi:hypothetical protein